MLDIVPDELYETLPDRIPIVQIVHNPGWKYSSNAISRCDSFVCMTTNSVEKLFSQGVKFTLVRLENSGVAQLELKIDEIEFSRWLELMVDFRQNYALYASDVVLKKNDGVGVVQVSATLVQAR
jgi:hypothetical protein